MSKLYEIANEYAKLMDSDLEPEMIADTIEGMEGEFTDKIEQLLAIIKNESGYAERLKDEAKSLTLNKIADALCVPITELFERRSKSNYSTHFKPHLQWPKW